MEWKHISLWAEKETLRQEDPQSENKVSKKRCEEKNLKERRTRCMQPEDKDAH